MLARILTVLLSVAPVAVYAQWPAYKTAGPRTADGKIDLAAPTPKTADGHTDFTGIWQYQRPPGTPAPAPSVFSQPPAKPGEIIPASVRTSQFWNLGASFKDGLPFQPWAAELHKQRVVENSKDNPDAHCLPMGLLQFNNHGQPRKMIQTRDVVVILYEANAGIRQIFIDGRPLPKDAEPWWYGYSIGKWDGAKLVVETIGLRDLGWLDVEGSPITESGKIIERFKRTDFGHLEIETTIDDPKAYTKPWSITTYQRLTPDTELIEMVCQENEQDAQHLRGK